jgi:F-type H+-transporting ATPase subunit epsilon
MKLKILLPTEIFLEKEVTKVTAEAENGSFCLLPRHIDFVSALVPGLLFYEADTGEEEFLAIDAGILVKCGSEVLVSTGNAVMGPDLGTLREMVAEQFRVLDEQEKELQSALAKLEVNFARQLLELEKKHG